MGVGDSHDQRLQQLPLLDAVPQFLHPRGVGGAHASLGDEYLAGFDVEDVPHERSSRHACRLRTFLPATLPISASTLASTHANRRLLGIGGARNCEVDSPGHCCGRTPTVDESRAKENPHRCVCKGGLPPLGSFEAPTLGLQIASAFFWMQRRKMCGILAHMPCGDDDLAEIDVEDVPHERTSRHACRLRTFLPATPPISASILAPTHANRRLVGLGWRELQTANRQPRALLRPDSRRR